jgi:GTP-binding protein
MPVHILLTKADKLSRGNAGSVLISVKKELKNAGLNELVSAQIFSSLKNTGLEDLKLKLQTWLDPCEPMAMAQLLAADASMNPRAD